MTFKTFFANSILFLLFAGKLCAAEDLKISGSASVDSTPVRGGTVLIYEMHGKLFQMPEAVIRAVAITDKDGHFEVSLSGVQGYLDLQLVPDICNWSTSSTLISREEIEKAAHGQIVVRLDAALERCDPACEKSTATEASSADAMSN